MTARSRLFGPDTPGPERRRSQLEVFERLGMLSDEQALELEEFRAPERELAAERERRRTFSASGVIQC